MAGSEVTIAIGGTGVIGTALAAELVESGNQLSTLSLDPDKPDGTNIYVDLCACTESEVTAALERAANGRRVAGILDILGCKGPAARAVASFAERHNARVCIISSCLLYKHSGHEAVDEACPIHQNSPTLPSYLRSKLALEEFWRGCTGIDCTFIRAHHIVGRGGLLGCIPAHNRDPQLIEHIRSGRPLSLARQGQVALSYIHPRDLALMAKNLLLGARTTEKVVNAAYPVPVKAIDYYREIYRQLGVHFVPPVDYTPDPEDFWSVTAKDNVITSNTKAAQSHTFRFDYRAAIHDALSVGESCYPTLGKHMFQRIS